MKIIQTKRFKKSESDYNRNPSFGIPVESIMDSNVDGESEQGIKKNWLKKKIKSRNKR